MNGSGLKMVSVLWKEILSLDYTPLKTKDEVIVEAVTSAILQGKIAWGEKLPPYRELALLAGVDKSYMEKAMIKLRDRDGLIVTVRGRATFVISRLAYVLKDHEEPKTMKPVRQRRLLYNQETLLGGSLLLKAIDTSLSKGFETFRAMDSDQRKIKIIPGLIEKLTHLLNHALPAKYSVEEIHYTQDYVLLMNNICEVCLPAKKAFVMIQPAAHLICNVVSAQGKEIVFCAADKEGMSMADLERICSSTAVGVVYLSSRTVYPYAQTLSAAKIQHLQQLQRKYRFTIIEDDRHAGFFINKGNVLMQHFMSSSAKVIYLRPLSVAHPDLLDFRIIAAPLKISIELKNKFRNGGKGVSAVMAQSINALLDKRVLNKCEPKIHLAIAATVERTKRLLGDARIWNMERLNLSAGWYICLEPLKGAFPDNILSLLDALSITVMNPQEYRYAKKNNNMIRISIAAYLDGLHLERDIKVLNDLCRKAIR